MADTLPLTYKLAVYSGASFRREFRWKPDGVQLQDFTGWSAVMRVGSLGQTAIIQMSTQAGSIVLSGTGQIILALSATQTDSLKPGVYSYDLDLIDPTSFVLRFLRGRLEVIRDVS